MALELTFEEIGPLRLCISKEHRFGTDAFLLADFAQARRGDRACDLGCGGRSGGPLSSTGWSF